jgi:hypothetical protein
VAATSSKWREATLMERTGWFVQATDYRKLNEPFLMLRAVALALRARLRR